LRAKEAVDAQKIIGQSSAFPSGACWGEVPTEERGEKTVTKRRDHVQDEAFAVPGKRRPTVAAPST
jgi:hypothetical protein